MGVTRAIKAEQIEYLIGLIKENYITNLTVENNIITFTRGDGSSGRYEIEDTVYNLVSTTEAGLMSPADKNKLDNIRPITDEEINEICGESIVYASEATKF